MTGWWAIRRVRGHVACEMAAESEDELPEAEGDVEMPELDTRPPSLDEVLAFMPEWMTAKPGEEGARAPPVEAPPPPEKAKEKEDAKGKGKGKGKGKVEEEETEVPAATLPVSNEPPKNDAQKRAEGEVIDEQQWKR